MDPNLILQEARTQVSTLLGDRLDQLAVKRAVLGLFYTGVEIDTGHGGLCATPVKQIPEAVCCPSSAKAMPLSGRLAGRALVSYLDDLDSPNVLKRTLGIAALNALTHLVIDEGLADRPIETDRDAFEDLHINPGEYVVVVGALIPVLRRLLKQGNEFSVLELDPRTLKGAELDHFAPADRFAQVVPKADVLVITGTTLINNTLVDLLDQAKPSARVAVIGSSVSILPDPLFCRGVDLVGGVRLTHATQALDVLAEGGSGYHLYGRCAQKIQFHRPS